MQPAQVTLKPNATDPQTGQTDFAAPDYDFGDGTLANDPIYTTPNPNGTVTHRFTTPGIYRVKANITVTPDVNTTVSSVAEDSIIAGATLMTKVLPFSFRKDIPPEEAGSGFNYMDTLKATFRDISPAPHKLRSATELSSRTIAIITKKSSRRRPIRRSFRLCSKRVCPAPEKTPDGTIIAVKGAGTSVSVTISRANFDRTGDPRFGRCELKGIFKNQRIAVAIIPANPNPRRPPKRSRA